MPYVMRLAETSVLGVGQFKNAKGNTECVEFVRRVTAAPGTEFWRPGRRVLDAGPGEIVRGTAIATFDDRGQYPTDGKGRHVAIYLSHDVHGIQVLDQWNSQGCVKPRRIRFHNADNPRGRSNDGDAFYVVETHTLASSSVTR